MPWDRIIFLDFGGVLTSERPSESRTHNGKFDPECVKKLNELIVRTGAKVCVTSDERERGIEALRKLFRKEQVVADIVGVTDVQSWDEDVVERGELVAKWLNQNPTRHFVIFDDQGDFRGDIRERLVQTNPYTGLQAEDGNRAERWLKGGL
jgi:hypothetical protein